MARTRRLGPAAPSGLGPPAPSRLPAGLRRSAAERLYDRRWARASAAFLAANPLCVGCRALGQSEPATLTDHVVPHRGDRRLFWEPANWQASCRWHHDAIKQALERRFEAGELDADDLRLDSAVAAELSRNLRSDRGGSRSLGPAYP